MTLAAPRSQHDLGTHSERPSQVAPVRFKRPDPKTLLSAALGMVGRRWLLLALSLFVAAGVAAPIAIMKTERVWKCTTVMLYTPLPIPDSEKASFAAFDLQTLSSLIGSRPVLQAVEKELELGFSYTLLEKILTVEHERNTSTVFVALSWGHQTEAKMILEKLTEVYPRQVAEMRAAIAHRRLAEANKLLEKKNRQLAAAKKTYQSFCSQHNIIDYEQDLVRIQTENATYRMMIETRKRENSSMQAQIKRLEEHLEQTRQELKNEAEAAKEFEAAEESLADNRRRQDRLRELIQEERRLVEIKAQLAVKQREYERARLLFQKQLIPASKLDLIRGEVEAIQARIMQTDTIKKWTKELTELDKLVVPSNPKNKKGSPIISQILFKKLETELNILQGDREITELTALVDRNIGTLAEIQNRRSELDVYLDAIANLESEREGIVEQISALTTLAAFGPVEFTVVSPPETGPVPVSSNRKKLFVGTAGVFFMLFGVMIAGYDAMVYGIIPLDARVALMGIDLWGKAASISKPSMRHVDAPIVDEVVRDVALRLRQAMRQHGGIVQLVNLGMQSRVAPFLQSLGQCLSARDERILIIDCRFDSPMTRDCLPLVDMRLVALADAGVPRSANPDSANSIEPLAGLSEYLAFRVNSLDEIALPTQQPGVDCILPGSASVHPDALATHRMSQLLAASREQYSLVIVISPPTAAPTEVQLLAGLCDGVLFTYRPGDRIRPQNQKTVQTLHELLVPVLGAVTIPKAPDVSDEVPPQTSI